MGRWPSPADRCGRAARTLPPWRDPLLALAFFLVTVQLRRPYKMLLPYAWDSILYLRAVDHFNATVHQPQPPGYLFYVSAARLFNLAVGDPHRALVWVSIVASAAAVAALYLLARLLYDWVTGVVAALLLTSVTFWFYGEIAYPYTALAACSTVLALLALGLRRGLLPGAPGVALATGAFGLLAGFRQDLLLFPAPLFVAALWGRPPRQWLGGRRPGRSASSAGCCRPPRCRRGWRSITRRSPTRAATPAVNCRPSRSASPACAPTRAR